MADLHSTVINQNVPLSINTHHSPSLVTTLSFINLSIKNTCVNNCQFLCLEGRPVLWLEVYVLATSNIILGWVLTCSSVHSWWPYSAIPLRNQAASTMTWYPTQSHYLATQSLPHSNSAEHLARKRQVSIKSLVWLDQGPVLERLLMNALSWWRITYLAHTQNQYLGQSVLLDDAHVSNSF